MKTMTNKERIDAVIAHKPVDRTPFCLVDGGAWIAKTENISYRTLYGMEDGGAAEIVRWTDEIETDVVSAVSGVFTACLNAFGCSIHIDDIGRPVDAGAAFTNPEEEIPLLDKNTIREKLLANEFVQNMLKQTRGVKRLAGDRKYLLGDIAGPFTMAAVMVGTQEFIMLM
ncbi:MAG: methyltransferase, partial [Clostridia bacterium]|nr:methyltransferase [Clostridia bacterium]